VRVLGTAEEIVRDEVALLPCPLRERHALDVTDHLTERFGPSDRIRVGIAHGGIKEILQSMAGDRDEEIHNTVPIDLAHTARLDYLALGDWHGTFRVDERTWYSGTPEPTRFKEQQPGNVLLVTVPEQGATPRVIEHPVATLKWQQLSWQLETADDIAALQRHLESLPGKHETLVELTLEGTLTLELYTRVTEALEGRLKAPFRHLRVRDERLLMRLSDDDLGQLPKVGWIGDVVNRLQAGVDGASAEEAQRALQLLHRLYTVGAAR
jgi:DNA repair exonuclease SbcCD nuclease subunit